MRDPSARHDGRWLMTPLDPRRGEIRTTTIMTTPRTNGSPRLFLPPSWYRVVSHGVSGLQDEILSTDHDVSRHNLAYIYISLLFSLPFSLALSFCLGPTIASPLQVGPLLLLSPLLPLPLVLLLESAVIYFKRLCSTVASGWSDSDAREKPIGAIKGIGSRRCKDRSFPPLYTTIYLVNV